MVRHQRGLALIVLITILSLGASYMLVNQMNAIAQALGTDASTRDAMAQAKAALIGRAAINNNRPGALLCPDTNNDGVAESTCSSANERVGRLPWKSLGLPDLRDSSGERFWYAISANFRDQGVINSNTLGTLSLRDDVADAQTSSGLVALIIAPGSPLAGQDRSGATDNATNKVSVSNYLEGKNNYLLDASATNDDSFVNPRATTEYPRGQCLISGVASECNDRVLAITHEDLFIAVEQIVARRIESSMVGGSDKSVISFIQEYFTTWGVLPYPVAFGDPDAVSYTGQVSSTDTYGLLPVTGDLNTVGWMTSSPNAPVYSWSGSYWDWGTSCNSTLTSLSCTISYSCGQPRITITAKLQNVGKTFFMERWTTANNPMTISGSSLSAQSVTHSLAADGIDTVTYSATLPNRSTCGSPRTRTITLQRWPATVTDPYNLTVNNSDVAWFIQNEWYKLTWYAITPGYRPGSGTPGTPASCTAPNCLSVITSTATETNRGAVLVLAGRTTGSQQRTTTAQRADTANYFEQENTAPAGVADTTYRKATRSATFNDKLVVVWPVP